MPQQTQGRSVTSPFTLVLKLLEADIKDHDVGVLSIQGFWLKMHRVLVKTMSAQKCFRIRLQGHKMHIPHVLINAVGSAKHSKELSKMIPVPASTSGFGAPVPSE